MKKILMTLLVLTAVSTNSIAGIALTEYENLLITEIVVTPTDGEMIEIHNKGSLALPLDNIYLTDATFAGGSTYYYQLVSGGGGGGGFADFFARFPSGASIAAGEYQTIALNGSDAFFTSFGVQPTYEIFEDAVSADAIPDMLEARPGSIDDLNSGLSGGEVAVLFYWDSTTDLVEDLDYVLWGDKVEAIDKSGVAIDGPDGDSDTSSYLSETTIANQDVVDANSHAGGNSWQRIDMSEGSEAQSGGNGINGADETSENLSFTFGEGIPTPNAASGISPPIAQFVINEIDAVTGGSDFIELFGNANTSTDDYTIVLYDGFSEQSTTVISLDGLSTDANGYLLINQTLEDGVDAVALYAAGSINFSIGNPVTTTDLMDAIVYGSGQVDDTNLISQLTINGAMVNEDANSNAMSESLIRCTNGSGGQLNTNSFKAFTPSPGAENANCITLDGYYDSVIFDQTVVEFKRSIHQIIDDHISFPYSSGGINDTWDLLSNADQSPTTDTCSNDPQTIEFVWLVYKNNDECYLGSGIQEYNREHTWPQSYGFSSGTLGTNNPARTDAHHLMMSEVGYNSDRGNLYFDDCDASCTERVTDVHNNPNPGGGTVGGGSGVYPGNSNWYDGNSFEVWNFRKGDIARAMFYMDVRYEASIAGDITPGDEVDLILTDNASLIQTGDPYMGLLSTLLAWHAADPVDDIERNRNDYLFTRQENRNPFIDHPEWVECIFVDFTPCQPVDLIFADGFE